MHLLHAALILAAIFSGGGAADGESGALVITRPTLPVSFNPYHTLMVPRSATKHEVRKAYKRALNAMGRAAAKDGHGQPADAEDSEIMKTVVLVRGTAGPVPRSLSGFAGARRALSLVLRRCSVLLMHRNLVHVPRCLN